MRWPCSLVLGCLALLLALPRPAAAAAPADADQAVADVVVIVDTSVSMKEPGMDPERTSLLVAKLFSDIVLGDLTVVRLLDLEADKQLLPRRDTGKMEPCQEDPSQSCHMVEPASDWSADARRGRFGAVARPARGDAAYKAQLDGHLAQASNNSPFDLAFAAAQGVFDGHAKREEPRTVVWLSDGRADHPEPVRKAIAQMVAQGTAVEAVVFGRGDVRLARDSGLQARQASSPAQLMKAFAGIFRRVVQAPYEIDSEVAANPSFEMKPNVQEAWIVVYGDDSLRGASLTGPQGTVEADYAHDSHPGAGAYRVAYLERPTAGRWTVEVAGGGPGAAFAVVQRSSLAPMLLAPKVAVAGARTQLVAGLTSGAAGTLVTDPGVLGETRMSVLVENRWISLADDGANGDAARGDGRFSGWARLRTVGGARLRVRAVNTLLDRTAEAVVKVSGIFASSGVPVEVDLGRIEAGGEACRPLRLAAARHEGAVPFELGALREPPSGHSLEVRLPGGRLRPGDRPKPIGPDDALQVCLRVSRRAPSSTATGEPWLALRLAGSSESRQAVTLQLRWQVAGLTFWQRWGWLILVILAVLLALFIVLGFVLPKRFQPSLAVTFVPERWELDEQTPQPVTQWKGVGIGFYRNARAFLHANYRLSGNPRGAVAGLFAEAAGTRVGPGRGHALLRESLDGDWEAVDPEGRRARGGDIYKIGDSGPFFRISSRVGRG